MAKKIDANVNANLLVMQEFDSAEQSYNAALAKWNELKSRVINSKKKAPSEQLMNSVKEELNAFIDGLGLSIRNKRDVIGAIDLDDFKISEENSLEDVPEEVIARALEGCIVSEFSGAEVWEKINAYIHDQECWTELSEILTNDDLLKLNLFLDRKKSGLSARPTAAGNAWPAEEEGRTWAAGLIKGVPVRFRAKGDKWTLLGLSSPAATRATGMTHEELVSWASINLPPPKKS